MVLILFLNSARSSGRSEQNIWQNLQGCRVSRTTPYPLNSPTKIIDSIGKAYNSTKNSRKLMELRSKRLSQYGVETAESGLVSLWLLSNLVPDYSPPYAKICEYFLTLYRLLILSSLHSNCNLLLPSF
jgi:hypothetical protein